VLALALALSVVVPGVRAQVAPATAQPGVWQEQSLDFDYMGFTMLYACTGLREKLRLVLQALGARDDMSLVESGCENGGTYISRLPSVAMHFATLAPASATPTPASAPTVAGAWRSVNLVDSRTLDTNECELTQQIIEKLLPHFAVRNVEKPNRCVPHAPTLTVSLHVEVFAPLTQAKMQTQTQTQIQVSAPTQH
jgi:hypothetical protein